MTRRTSENSMMAGTLFAFFVSGAGSLALGSLIPFFRSSYGLSYDFAGLLVSLQSAGNLAAVGLMGFLPSMMGRRKAVLITAIWMAAAYLIFVTGAGGARLLPAAFFMIGIARGGNANFANTMMSTLPGRKAAMGYNLVHGACAMGALLSPLLVVACVARSASGWRLAAAVLLGLCLLQLVDYLRIPLPPEPARRRDAAIDRGFLKHRSFWMASAIVFFYASIEYAITGWMVTYFQDIGILRDHVAQMMNSLFWLVMFAGRMIGAGLAGKISRSQLLVADGIGLLAAFVLVFFGRSEPVIFIGITGMGLFMATIYTSALALGTERVRGSDLGISALILAGSAGGIVAPAVVGFVAERAGIRAGISVVIAAIVALLGAIIATVSCPEE